MKEEEREFIREKMKEEEEWENSIEGIWYNLDGLIIGDVDGTERERTLIAKTLLKIPKEAREKVLDDRVHFIIMSGAHGVSSDLSLSLSESEMEERKKSIETDEGKSITYHAPYHIPLIILNFDAMRGKTDSYKMDIIAHEIAHSILEEGGYTTDRYAERKADDLVEKWGFKRTYNEEQLKEFEEVQER